ncbi:MAG: radical SAM protein [Polyangiales bacterium]
MRSRVERFGAWVQLDPSTLVAIDRRRARSLGLDGGELWNDDRESPHPFPIEVHVAVTARCPVECVGCYQDATAEGAHVSLDQLRSTLDALASAGVFTVALGGGEPLSRDDLAVIADEARARGISCVLTTSGLGLREDRVAELRGFSQVNVSHDGVDGGYLSLRGVNAAAVAERAITLLAREGIRVGVNMVLSRQTFARVEATAERARALGAVELQLLRYKPAGRAASIEYLSRRLTREQALAVGPLVERLSRAHGEAMAVRVDCAMVPFLAAYVRDARALERWGIFGCEAGRHLAAVDRDGAVIGCSFARDMHVGAPLDRWQSDAGLEEFRRFVAAPPEPCRSCEARAVCRGGCKVVSSHLSRAFEPDPECPRVIAWREEAR